MNLCIALYTYTGRLCHPALYPSGSQTFETRGPLTNFVSRPRTTTENYAMDNCQIGMFVCLYLCKMKKYPLLADNHMPADTGGSIATCLEPLLYPIPLF